MENPQVSMNHRVTLRVAVLTGLSYLVGATGLALGKDKQLRWVQIAEGLQQVREHKRPAIVWYTGKTTAEKPHFFEEFLDDRRFRRLAEKFVLIRLDAAGLSAAYPSAPQSKPPRAKARKDKAPPRAAEPPPKPTIATQLRLLDDPTAFLILDFRERVIRRYEPQKTPPRLSKLTRQLTRVLAASARHVETARQVEKTLAAAARAKANKKMRAAVLKILPLDSQEKRDRLDPVLREKVEAVIQQYRDEAEKLFLRAQGLVLAGKQNAKNSGKKFAAALAAYDRLARDFPFRDIRERANVGKDIVVTWMNLQPGGGIR